PIQGREIAVGGLCMSHSDYQATFATGDADSATLVVDWPDGRRTVLENVRPNRLYEITPAMASARVPADSVDRARGSPLFEDATAQLGGHVHSEPQFDDWQRQFLLPNSLSQLGPGLAWLDYDRDGDEDLLIGTGRGGRLGVFRNDAGRLVPRPREGPLAPADLTSIVGLVGGEGMKVLVGVSSWEDPPTRGAAPVPAVASTAAGARGVSTTAEPIVLPRESATGPIALGDYDADGDLDLFVGGRAIPAQYPRSASSALFRNDGGRFIVDSANVGVLGRAGLVSAALFADVDGDGDPDLVLGREWDSIMLLLNDRGRLTPAPDSWGLARWTSRWNGVAAGDVNGDGRLDLVATSWGRNTATPADTVRPLVLLHGPFGSAGEEELLLARHDLRLRGLAPLNSYPRVRVAIPGLPSRVSTFAAYADATVERVLGPLVTKVERKQVITLDHMVFLNRGNRFEGMSLPVEAQLSPAFYAGIADFDGDGSEDIFLSQNFFPTALGIPRYDAGRGLLLTGDGKGGFRPMPGHRSGILIYGDQRGAAYADYDRDGRLDLAVSQNGAATRLLRNRGAKPGLRVRLEGPASNADAVGAQVRVVYGARMGPVREIHAGSGYWSQNGAAQVFAITEGPTAVWVRWPGGAESRAAVPPGAREVVVRRQ
ncbi:MAG: FG-GAP-like repeat-containing protein, partial [Gemmatimonadaceae bacterium]